MRLVLFAVAAAAAVCGQKPVIFPGGVVNAATYATGGRSGKAVAGGSLVSIFGSNLAATTQAVTTFPLPPLSEAPP